MTESASESAAFLLAGYGEGRRVICELTERDTRVGWRPDASPAGTRAGREPAAPGKKSSGRGGEELCRIQGQGWEERRGKDVALEVAPLQAVGWRIAGGQAIDLDRSADWIHQPV